MAGNIGGLFVETGEGSVKPIEESLGEKSLGGLRAECDRRGEEGEMIEAEVAARLGARQGAKLMRRPRTEILSSSIHWEGWMDEK